MRKLSAARILSAFCLSLMLSVATAVVAVVNVASRLVLHCAISKQMQKTRSKILVFMLIGDWIKEYSNRSKIYVFEMA